MQKVKGLDNKRQKIYEADVLFFFGFLLIYSVPLVRIIHIVFHFAFDGGTKAALLHENLMISNTSVSFTVRSTSNLMRFRGERRKSKKKGKYKIGNKRRI